MNKLRTALRERTRAAHERLDGMFSSLDLKKRDDYARFLAAQAAPFHVIEKRLDEAGARSVIPDWSQRKRSEAIRLDLAALGGEVGVAENGADWIRDKASILGAAYVLEGSRLGGTMLLRDVLASADPQMAEATRFLGHGGKQRLWPSFDALLAASDLSDSETDRMVESAIRTFAFFEASAEGVL